MLRRGVSFLLVFACALSCVALLYLALVSPPRSEWLRVGGLLVLGAGAGLLNLALFHAISPGYQADAAGTVNKGGILYGLGCLAATLLVAGTFYAYTVPSILIFMALVPGFFAGVFSRARYRTPPAGSASDRTCARRCRIFAVRARCCSPCCCFSSSATSGRLPGGCRSS